jgi:hypothetical protein
VSDGDTRSPNKFVNAQKTIVGDAAEDDPERIPNIGHAMKGISIGFYKLSQADKTYSGVKQLTPNRIRAIVGDVSHHIHNYHEAAYAANVADEEKDTYVLLGKINGRSCGKGSN